MPNVNDKDLRNRPLCRVDVSLKVSTKHFLLLLLCVLSQHALLAQRDTSASFKHGQMGLSLGTGQVAAYRYKGAAVEDAPLSGMLNANFSLGYFITEHLMLETGISSLNGSTRFKQGDSLRDFQLSRAAVPLRVGYYFQGSAA
ncbi:MAG: hypothetical protein RI842_08015, partial [Schleiferiaceae bacterium]|nr:hypothetical protein [Schleiferiaceae bacterium]